MSAVGSSLKSVPIYSGSVSAGKRSFFFDVKRAPHGELYFMISELTGKGDVWTRSRVLVPYEQAREFYTGLCDAIKAMREADKESPPPKAASHVKRRTPNQSQATPKVPAIPRASGRATGRASQGPNRSALV